MHASTAISLLLLTALTMGAQGITENDAGTPGVIPLTPANATDIWISSSTGMGVNSTSLRVGGNGDQNHILIRFDVQNFPVNTDLRLMLFCFGNGGGSSVPMALDVVTSPWDDGTVWTTAPSSSFIKTLAAPSLNTAYLIDLTLLFQQWKSGAIPNYGIKLRPLGNNNQYNEFYSAETTGALTSPRLIHSRLINHTLHFPVRLTYSVAQLTFIYAQHAQNAYCGPSPLLNTGVGLPAPVGTRVEAVESGVVKLVDKNPKGGNFIAIEHQTASGSFFTSIYEHVEPLTSQGARSLVGRKEKKLKEGDWVEKGDVIGTVLLGPGLTEPQLHFRIRESRYDETVSLLNRLPALHDCGGAPAFPEFFYSPLDVRWQ